MLILIFAFILSISFSSFNINKFDKIEEESHLMIRGDIDLIWKEAQSFKNNFISKKPILESGLEYKRTFLPSKLLAFYSILSSNELFETSTGKYKVGGKFLYLFIQSLIYYLSVYFFYNKLEIFYRDKKRSYYILLFLCFEPTIIQWHSSFWTESLYLSFQLIIFGMVIKDEKKNFDFFLIGLFTGILLLQKTVAFFLVFILLVYFLIDKSNKKYVNCLLILLGYLFVIAFLAFSNFKKTGIFYVMPSQTKDAHYTVFLPQIYLKKNEPEKILFQKERLEEWKIKNNYDENNFKKKKDLNDYKQSIAINEILKNKLISFEIYLINTLHHILLNPFQVYYWHEYNKSSYKIQYHLSEDKKRWLLFRIIYSSIFYLLIILGVINLINRKKQLNFHIMIFSCVLYYAFMLGWVGNTRYFVPSIILLSIFFGNGIYSIINFKK